jgi:hypothetical protein
VKGRETDLQNSIYQDGFAVHLSTNSTEMVIDTLSLGMNACCTVLSTVKNNAKQEKKSFPF